MADEARLGEAVRGRRRELGWTVAQLAEAAGCSKAYVSAIENDRLDNPPSARVIESLERALGVDDGALRRLADWAATPAPVKAQLAAMAARLAISDRRADGSMNLDALYRSGALREAAGAIDAADDAAADDDVRTLRIGPQVPLINKVAAGYPTDFGDLDYPARVADEYVACPDVADADAFAARVVGDSMLPEYREGDVIVFSPNQPAASGSDCFVRLLPDHQTTFKRVYFEEGERIRLQPLNPAFAARVVERDEVDGLYPAVYRMQRIGGGGRE